MTVAVAAVASVGVSAYGTYQAGKSADKAAKNQASAIDSQNRIAQAQLDMSKEDRQYYKDNYQPLELGLVQDAGISTAEANQMVASAGLNTQNAFDSAEAQRLRNMERMGVNPNSGSYADNARKSSISKAVAKANAQNAARSTAQQMDYTQKVAAVGLGKGLSDSAAGLMSSAAGIYGNSAAAYGSQSQMYGQSAANIANLGMQIGGAALGAQGPNGFDSTKFGNNFIGNYGVQK